MTKKHYYITTSVSLQYDLNQYWLTIMTKEGKCYSKMITKREATTMSRTLKIPIYDSTEIDKTENIEP